MGTKEGKTRRESEGQVKRKERLLKRRERQTGKERMTQVKKNDRHTKRRHQ